MAQGIIDHLKIIQIHKQDRGYSILPFQTFRNHLFHRLVIKARERVGLSLHKSPLQQLVLTLLFQINVRDIGPCHQHHLVLFIIIKILQPLAGIPPLRVHNAAVKTVLPCPVQLLQHAAYAHFMNCQLLILRCYVFPHICLNGSLIVITVIGRKKRTVPFAAEHDIAVIPGIEINEIIAVAVYIPLHNSL